MGRPSCDPIDIATTLADLAAGKPRPIVYADYASVAARPYARASWETILRKGRQEPRPIPKPRQHAIIADGGPIKPSTVLALVSDGPSLTVKGDALHVRDGPIKLVYERRSRKPEAIVTTGWGGSLTVNAVRYCADHKIALIMLDWGRDLMSVVATPAPRAAKLLRAQCSADPLIIARAIIRAKIEAHANEGALSPLSRGLLDCARNHIPFNSLADDDGSPRGFGGLVDAARANPLARGGPCSAILEARLRGAAGYGHTQRLSSDRPDQQSP